MKNACYRSDLQSYPVFVLSYPNKTPKLHELDERAYIQT